MKVLGRLPWSSNATFLVEVTAGGSRTRAVYKPGRGERPLWDYPPDLYRRERAAYLVSQILGWDLIPETVLRDGEFGAGAVQRFVPADFGEHYFSIIENARHHGALQAIGVLDLLINNGDRKGGHVLAAFEDDDTGDEGGEGGDEGEHARHQSERDGVGDHDGVDHDHGFGSGDRAGPATRIWAIDHGLSLHAHDKLRTVIWDFAGRPLPAELLPDVARLATELTDSTPQGSPASELAELLDHDELRALAQRARALVELAVFPMPQSGRSYPWPLV